MGFTNGHGASKAPCDAFLRGECTLGSKCSRSHRMEDLINSSIIDDAASDAPIGYEAGIVHDNNHADIRRIQILPTFDEIRSMLPAHLPPFNAQLWHESGIKGLIDRQFRLFRASAINELVERLRLELHSLQGTSLEDPKSLVRRWPTFQNAIVEEISHRHHEGFKIRVSFDQPCQSRTSQQRSGYWIHSKHMKWSNIVALLSEGRLVFCEVLGSPPRPGRMATVPGSLFKDANRAALLVKPITPTVRSFKDLMFLKTWRVSGGKCALIDFEGLLLPSFLPTLDALKRISESRDIPFSDMLTVSESTSGPQQSRFIPRPLYLTQSGIEINFRSICSPGQTVVINPCKSSQSDISKLSTASQLDQSQAEAVLGTLSRSLALLQGPPGTGKSFVGVALIKTLVALPRNVDVGPIICVCCTNHALDQLLEHLLDAGIRDLVRVGSRSKSERLAPHLFQKAGKRKNPDQKLRSAKVRAAFDKIDPAINFMFNDCRTRGVGVEIRDYLNLTNRSHESQVFGGSQESESAPNKFASNRIQSWVNGGLLSGPSDCIRRPDEVQSTNVHSLLREERKLLYYSWLDGYTERRMAKIGPHVTKLFTLHEDMDAIRRESAHRALSQRKVIGMTTTGFSMHRKVLEQLGSKILVCEEAGEVVEAQLLASLLPSTQHAILIGDHLQLCPRVDYHMSRESLAGRDIKFDMSLFERLVIDRQSGGSSLPYSTLQVQRRMHPEIAELVKSTLYPRLRSSPPASVQRPVIGVQDRLFWFDHNHAETKGSLGPQASASNDFEVNMIVKFTRHIISQGQFAPSDIAIITPYNSQLENLRGGLRTARVSIANQQTQQDVSGNHATTANGGSGVRIATVDDFQGEEAKIVVLSLVRCNSRHNCGFVGNENRINVMLSRAKCGMYIFGSTDTFRHVPMWRKVMDILKRQNRIGKTLHLNRGNRLGTAFKVARPEDF